MIDLYVMRDPQVWDEGGHAGGITDAEWVALFYNSFGCFMGINEPYLEGEPIENWNERVRVKFQSAIPDYPLLGRLWDVYGDYWYSAGEVGQLREECVRASTEVSDESARNALEKFARACEKALSRQAGLAMAGD